MRFLGLDIGDVRTGIAVCDHSESLASPIAVVPTRELTGDARRLSRLVEEYEAESLVVGLPLTLAGEEGPQARRVRAMAEQLARNVRLPLMFVDERLTSAQAARAMAEAGLSTKDQRGRVDMVAAAIMLQVFLDARRTDVQGSSDDDPDAG